MKKKEADAKAAPDASKKGDAKKSDDDKKKVGATAAGITKTPEISYEKDGIKIKTEVTKTNVTMVLPTDTKNETVAYMVEKLRS